MSPFRGVWQSLNFDKEYLFGFETLVFATSGILSMHNQYNDVDLYTVKKHLLSDETLNRGPDSLWSLKIPCHFS